MNGGIIITIRFPQQPFDDAENLRLVPRKTRRIDGSARLLEPRRRQVYPAVGRILHDVAADVGELKRDAEIDGAIQRLRILTVEAKLVLQGC